MASLEQYYEDEVQLNLQLQARVAELESENADLRDREAEDVPQMVDRIAELETALRDRTALLREYARQADRHGREHGTLSHELQYVDHVIARAALKEE